MTKKDVLEIRHQFAPSTCSISKICGCYVDGDNKKVATIKEQFLTMPEEETFKYFEIFKKTLSGSIGKNLVTMPFPTSQEFDVDFYSGFVYEMLGIPRELYTPLFAVARIVGWSAHRIEELVTTDKIIRPAYKSLVTHRDYVDRDAR